MHTVPYQNAAIGGASMAGCTVTVCSVFQIDFAHGCAIVEVDKDNATTTIISRGYNTCDVNSQRRFERGIKVVY